MTEPPAEDFQARSTRLRVVVRKWFQALATRGPNSSIIIPIVPSFSAPPTDRFPETPFALRLYYMRYNKSANTAKLTFFARRPATRRPGLIKRIQQWLLVNNCSRFWFVRLAAPKLN